MKYNGEFRLAAYLWILVSAAWFLNIFYAMTPICLTIFASGMIIFTITYTFTRKD